MMWDLLLYVPTVLALFAIGLKLWFGPTQTWAYVLFFMASFFLFAGANRVLSGRLMLLPSAPCAIRAPARLATSLAGRLPSVVRRA